MTCSQKNASRKTYICPDSAQGCTNVSHKSTSAWREEPKAKTMFMEQVQHDTGRRPKNWAKKTIGKACFFGCAVVSSCRLAFVLALARLLSRPLQVCSVLLFRCLDFCAASAVFGSALGADPRTGLFCGRYPFRCSGLWFFTSEATSQRASWLRVRRDGSDGWRSPVTRGDNIGKRVRVPPPPPIAAWPADKSRTSRCLVDGARDGRS